MCLASGAIAEYSATKAPMEAERQGASPPEVRNAIFMSYIIY